MKHPATSCGESPTVEENVIYYSLANPTERSGVSIRCSVQDKGDVCLIRHSYVRSSSQKRGIGTELLKYLESKTDKPVLIGTWADATWALSFYRKKGYRLLPGEEKNRLLHTYWTIPERQVETSVVLANHAWFNAAWETEKVRK